MLKILESNVLSKNNQHKEQDEVDDDDQFQIDPEDQHENFLKLQDLEKKRRYQALESIKAKFFVRKKISLIKEYKELVLKRKQMIKDQTNKIIRIQAMIELYKIGLENFEEAEKQFIEFQDLNKNKPNSDIKKQLKIKTNFNKYSDIKERNFIRIRQNNIESSESSVIYKNIDDIPSDRSESLDDNKNRIVKYNKGTWTEKERYIYFQFLDENRDIFDDLGLSYTEKIFVRLAKAVKTRTVKQCRSFHNQIVGR